jgi:hypothetical protein
MEEWHDFFVATVGASATLTGLIFVGVSISLKKILAIPTLPSRAIQSLALLLCVLIVSALCLAPRQTAVSIGTEILTAGIIIWAANLKIDMDVWNVTQRKYRKYWKQNIVFTQLAVLPYIIAGAMTLINGFDGIYWLLPAIIFSFIKSVLDAWVLLIEIHR